MTKAAETFEHSTVTIPVTVPRSPIAKTKLFFQLYWKRGKPGQATAPWALNFAYGMWLTAFAFKLIGSSWDMSWHFQWIRDDFAPPHLINTVGTGIILVLVAIHSYTGLGCDKRSLRLMQIGTFIFLIAAPLDVINHRVNGLDLTAWSPSHLMLYLGTGVMLAGVIDGWLKFSPPGRTRTWVLIGLWTFFLENTFFPNGQQEYGILGLRSWERGQPEAEPTLLGFAAEQLGRPVDRQAVLHFTLPIPDWVYPLWGIGVMALILALARWTVGKAWTATIVAVLYVGYRGVIWPLLMAGGFPTSTVPFYLLFLGLAIDLTFRLARQRTAIIALLGALSATVLGYGALYLQSLLRPWFLGDAHTESAPPIAYWTIPITAVGIAALWWVTPKLVHWWNSRPARVTN